MKFSYLIILTLTVLFLSCSNNEKIIKKIVTTTYQDEKTHIETVEYDRFGNILNRINLLPEIGREWTEKFQYKYDSNHNVVEKKELDNEKYPLGKRIVYEYDSNNKPYRYKFNITNHISNVIRKDSTNFDLGLVVSSNINDIFRKKAIVGENEFLNYPRSSILNPLGAILVGSNLPEEENNDKKVQLEIIYTEY